MASGSADQPAREPAPDERYGPLSLLRMRKDDGRSLILYERTDGAGAAAPASAGASADAPTDDDADGAGDGGSA
jgi:hypothetical protein